jgi:branched-chain amino acid aminotransferase
VPSGKKIWFDGKLVDWKDANVHVLTHALHYGLGVFEGIRCYRCEDGTSSIFRLTEHTARLFNSAKIAQMEIPFTPEEINEAIKETLRANDLKEAYIRPLAFLGDGGMGIFPKDNPVRVSIAAWEWGAYLGDDGIKNGIRVKISSFNRHHVNAAMTKAKLTGSYVNSIMAKREVVAAGYDEALLLDTDGYVAEGSGENIFMIKNNILKTTPIMTVLDGITRDSVITIARDEGLELREERFTRDELYCADEAFFTGTAAEITPIRELDDRTIGTGKPGPVTKKIQAIYFDAIKGKDTRYERWLNKT